MADPLDGANPADPLASAQPAPWWKVGLAAAVPGTGELMNYLQGTPKGQSVLDPTTRLQHVQNWTDKNLTPWGILGISKADYDKQSAAQQAVTRFKASLKIGADIATSPARTASDLAQTAVRSGGGLLSAAAAKGEGLATLLPGGPSVEDLPAINAQMLVTPAGISGAAETLANKLRLSQSPQSPLNQPQTLAGQVADLGNQAGVYAVAPELGAGAAGVPAGLARRAAVMGGLGVQGYGQGYQAGVQAGNQDPSQVGTAMGLSNALMGGLGYTSAFEPQATKLAALLGAGKFAPAAGAAAITVPEAALMTAMQGRVNQTLDPNAPTLSGSDFLQNLAALGGLKAAGKINYAKQAKRFNPSYEFPESRPVPKPIGGTQAPFDLENQLMNLRSQNLADAAVANNLTTLFKGISPDARAELSHYYSDLEAGLQPTPLSPEARAVTNNPAWQKAMGAMASRYNNVLALSGEQGQADQNHIPRVVTAGVEPEAKPIGGGQLSQSDASLASRQFFALQDPQGRRILVSPGEQAKPGVGASMVPVGGDKADAFAPNGDGTYGPDRLQLKQASIREIEQQTPVRYRKDAITDLAQGVTGMGRVQRNMDFINNLLASHLVSPAGQAPPEGFVSLSPQAQNSFPALRGASLNPGLAQAFEAAAQRDLPPVQASGFVDKTVGGLGNLTRSAINLGFGINPFAHSGFNMPAHALDAAIKFGGLKDPGTAINAFSRASDAVNALRQGIATQDLVDYMNAGGTLMSGSKFIQEPFKATMGAAEPSINEKARLAVPSPYDPINQPGMKGMTDLSSHLTWGPDDTARMGLAFMLQDSKGMPLADAIQEANKTYPDYRNYMNRLANKPATNKLLYNFNKFGGTNFANYELKASGILGRNFLDLISPNILQEGGTRGQAAAGLATKAATYAALGTMMGSLIQSLTHDPRSEFAGAGSGHLIHQAAQDYRRLGGGPMGALQTLPTLAAQRVIPGAALNLLMNQMGHSYQGKQPTNPTDAQDAWLNLKSMIDPALHGELDKAKEAMAEGALDSAKSHMANFLSDYAKSLANATIYNGGDIAGIGQPKTDASTVLTRMFLRGTRGGTDAEQTADMLSAMRSQRFPPNANQVARANDKLAYALALKQQDWDSAEEIANKGNLSDKDLSKLQNRFGGDRIQNLVAQVGSMPFADAVRVFANGTAAEKEAMFPVVSQKLQNAYAKLDFGTAVPQNEADAEELYRSGPAAQWRESKRLFDMAASSLPDSPLQDPEPLADAKPVAGTGAAK